MGELIMRKIITTLYTFGELSEAAQIKAVTEVTEKLGGSWWDSSDTDDIAKVIICEFATAIGAPEVEDYGVADFPGTEGVSLDAWDLNVGLIVFNGMLTRTNAPGLPWPDSVGYVELRGSRNHRSMHAYAYGVDQEPSFGDGDILFQKIKEAERAALKAGQDEVEHKTSEETAREWCENNKNQEYTEDGTLA